MVAIISPIRTTRGKCLIASLLVAKMLAKVVLGVGSGEGLWGKLCLELTPSREDAPRLEGEASS